MIKKFLYTCSLALGLLLSGCAQDDWFTVPGSDVPDRDYAEIELAVSAPQTVRTRAGYNINDSQISNATVLIYRVGGNLENSTFLQGETFRPTNGARDLKSIKIAYNNKVKEECRSASSSLYFFVIANHTFLTDAEGKPVYPQSVKELEELKDNIAASGIPSRTNVTMTGIAVDMDADASNWAPAGIQSVKKATLNQTVTVKMTRDIARAYVSSSTGEFELQEYSIWSAAPEGYIIGGLTGSVSTAGMGKNPEDGSTFPKNAQQASACSQVPSADASNPNYVYAYGQKAVEGGKLGEDNRAFVIIKGDYKNNTCYYRVDLRKEKPQSAEDKAAKKPVEYDYFYLTPNHEYQIDIIRVKSKGYDSAEEAARHPQDDFLEVTIHDHVPSVLSMTSDGKRELGVETPVEFGSTDNTVTATKSSTFTMKLFSVVGSGEYPTEIKEEEDGKKLVGDNFSAEVTSGSQWLRLSAPSSGGASDIIETGESTSDGGKIYKVGVKSISSLTAGTLEGKVTVKWRGLERVVDVKWMNSFDLSSVMTAKLSLDYDGTTTDIGNYWSFLDNPNNTVSNSKLAGAGGLQNCGEIRNEGIHLPMGIGGKDASKYKMTYELTLKSPYAGKDITASIVNDIDGSSIVFPKGCFKTEGDKITITVDASSFGNQYFTGKLHITAGTETLPEIAVYHTGFFWNIDASDDAYTKAAIGKPAQGWYYYEVRSFGGRLWLDRNIGATSGGMAMIDKNGSSPEQVFKNNVDEFNQGAIGSYYVPADKDNDKKVEEHLYNECLLNTSDAADEL